MFLEELQEIFMEPIGELGVAVGDVAAKTAELNKALKSDRSKPPRADHSTSNAASSFASMNLAAQRESAQASKVHQRCCQLLDSRL